MLTRLTHAAIAFAVTVVVYQAYILLAVPLLEPPAAETAALKANLAPPDGALPPAVHKYHALLSAYFPSDHWSLQKPPISFDTGQTMFVLDKYDARDDGQVQVNKCVLMFFPHERLPGEAPPRDAIILEASHGVVLQLDEGFRAGFNGIGRIQWARLVGEIIVRSDMHEAGPQDDLMLRTRDLYMNQDLIRTDAEVEMKLGPHWGKGKELEMRLVAIERGKSSSADLNIGGIDSLEIVQDVAVQLAVKDNSLFSEAGASEPQPPVLVTSQGRFRYDFTSNVASFVDKVRLEQKYPNGKQNSLLCDALNLFFAGPTETVATQSAEAEDTSFTARTREIMTLRPGTIEAQGSELHPVRLSSEVLDARAECAVMQIQLDSQRITFSAPDEIQLDYQGTEVHAPWVQYTAPPRNSGQRIGTFRAAGNGFLRSFPRSGDKQPLELNWSDGMDLRRVKGKPVLTVRGRPRLQLAGGRLWADELEVVLRERGPDAFDSRLLPADASPEQLTARGHVDLRSAELNGKIKELKIDVQYLPTDLLLGSPAQPPSGSGRSLLTGGAAGGRTYNIEGDALDVGVVVRDGKSQISSIDVTGQLEFREEPLPGHAAQPLIVHGEELHVRNADTSSAKMSLRGSPASITAAGMSMQTIEIQVNRGTSGALIDSPGKLQIPLDHDLQGNLLPQPEPLEITWQGGMNLEYDRITFQGDVVARTPNGQLNTQRLVAVLSAPISFDGTTQTEQARLAQLECWEGVRAKFIQRDTVGIRGIHEVQLESLLANQISGVVSGQGPGWVESHHLAVGKNSLPAFPNVTPTAHFASAAASSTPQHLRVLRIEFDTGVQGNLIERHLSVLGDVHAVYGPVDSWEQTLPVLLQGMPAPDTVYIECQQLQVAQSPNARISNSQLPAVELNARGSVIIEGPAGNQGTFTARGHVAKYDQLKSKFELEWDGIHPATFVRQQYPGAPFDQDASFHRCTYFLDNGHLEWDGIEHSQILVTPKN